MPGDQQPPWVSIDRIRDEVRDEEDRARFVGQFPQPTPGQLVYERWCGSNRSDRARYFRDMSPGDKDAWEDMASEIRARMSDEAWQAFIHNIREYR